MLNQAKATTYDREIQVELISTSDISHHTTNPAPAVEDFSDEPIKPVDEHRKPQIGLISAGAGHHHDDHISPVKKAEREKQPDDVVLLSKDEAK